jgi:hypothetical protein
VAAHGPRYARLRPVYLGDDLFSRQPICDAVLAAGGHFLFVCKPDSHATIEEFRTGIVLDELTRKVRRGKQWATHRYQRLSDVPLRGDAKTITVNWLMIEIRDADGALTCRNSSTGQPRQRRRTRRLWSGAVEDRERDVQRPENQGLQSGAQFRPREAEPFDRIGHPEPAGLRMSYRL